MPPVLLPVTELEIFNQLMLRRINYMKKKKLLWSASLPFMASGTPGFLQVASSVGKLFSKRAAVTNFKFERAVKDFPKAFQKLDFHAIKMKDMLKSFENIIHPKYGNALYVYNAFIRYQAIKTRK